jgi:hypothetical protein
MTATTCLSGPLGLSDPAAADPSAVDEADVLAASVRRAERRLRMLERASEITMDVMESLRRQVLAGEPSRIADPADAATPAASPAVADPAAALAKLSRSLRLTLDLEARFDEALRTLRAGETSARETCRRAREARAEAAADEQREATRDRIHTQVCRAIRAEAETEEEISERLAALTERLDVDPAYDEADERPLREVVEQLCGDLGLSPDWSAWTEDDGWQDPADSPPYRVRSSRFNRVSPKPILKANQNWSRDLASRLFELADDSP